MAAALPIRTSTRWRRMKAFGVVKLFCDPKQPSAALEFPPSDGVCVGGLTMKALVWHGKEDIRCDTVTDPKIENSRDAIIKVTSCAICGSDLHLFVTRHDPVFQKRFGNDSTRSRKAFLSSCIALLKLLRGR